MNVKTLAPTGIVDAWRSAPMIVLGIGLVALGFLFRTEVLAAVGVWEASTAYNHCFLVIPIVAYLIWDRRDTLQDVAPNPYPLAALAGVPLAIAWLIAERLGIMEGRQLIAMSFAELLFFVVLGPRMWWRVAGPLLYLYFLVPFGAFLTPKLQDITTVFVSHGLPILGIPAYITGYSIEIPEGRFLIAEACAGLRFLIAAVAFGCLYALVMYRSPLRRAIFIAVSIVVPVIANGFRALGIVAMGHYMGSAQAVEADHVLYGWIFFSIVILILIVLGLPFRQDQRPPATARPARRVHPNHLRPAIAGAIILLAVAAAGPAVAVQFDRLAVPALTADLPRLAPAVGCQPEPVPLTTGLDAPGRMIVQRFDCGDGPVTLTIEVLSPRTSASHLASEQRRLTPGLGVEDVENRPLPVANTPPGTWRLIDDPASGSVSATSLWIDGRPAQLSLTVRAIQAWRSVVGAPLRPIVVVVDGNDSLLLADAAVREQAKTRIRRFLEAETALPELITRLAGVKD